MITAASHFKQRFGHKMYKAAISLEVTCPNRDGTKGVGGCAFCSEEGSGEFASSCKLPVKVQIDDAIKRLEKKVPEDTGYIAYFQSFTSTYCDADYLRGKLNDAASHPKVEAVSVATRPDCLPQPILDVLEEERESSAEAVISLTDKDETNLVISMYSWSCRIPSIITRVDKPEHVKLLHRVNIDITVSATELSALKMARFVRSYEMSDAPNEIGKFYNIAENRAEVMDFTATADFPALNISLGSDSFRLKKDTIITSLIRKGELIIPSGDSCIMEGDRVIITSAKSNRIRNLKEILK